MEVNYTEKSEVTREYVVDVDVEDYKDYLDGEKPTEENLKQYVEDMIADDMCDYGDESEYVIESGVNIDDFESIKEELEDLEEK